MTDIIKCKYENEYDDVNQGRIYRLSVTLRINKALIKNMSSDLFVPDIEMANGVDIRLLFSQQFKQMAAAIESIE